jgi:hypothetical protein
VTLYNETGRLDLSSWLVQQSMPPPRPHDPFYPLPLFLYHSAPPYPPACAPCRPA